MPILMAVLLALVWLCVSASWTFANALLGIILAAIVLFIVRRELDGPLKVRRPLKLMLLIGLFIVELAKSVWSVTRAVLRPKIDVKPGIMIFPLRLKDDFEIALLANLITLTPGTLTVDVTGDRTHLLIHALDCSDPDQTRRDIADGFERRIMEAFG